jgi:hypothetical protein
VFTYAQAFVALEKTGLSVDGWGTTFTTPDEVVQDSAGGVGAVDSCRQIIIARYCADVPTGLLVPLDCPCGSGQAMTVFGGADTADLEPMCAGCAAGDGVASYTFDDAARLMGVTVEYIGQDTHNRWLTVLEHADAELDRVADADVAAFLDPQLRPVWAEEFTGTRRCLAVLDTLARTGNFGDCVDDVRRLAELNEQTVLWWSNVLELVHHDADQAARLTGLLELP